jgi:hypothetical protein
MYFADSIPAMPTLKLFPRIAPTRATRKSAARTIQQTPQPSAGAHADERRSQVRARLLRMIVDNEQVRRNEQRPTAS